MTTTTLDETQGAYILAKLETRVASNEAIKSLIRSATLEGDDESRLEDIKGTAANLAFLRNEDEDLRLHQKATVPQHEVYHFVKDCNPTIHCIQQQRYHYIL
jgi:hypothetical protein